MASLRKSLALSALQSYIGIALQLVSTVVLSRILTPEEVGAFAVAAVFAALASNFRDFGIAEYLIQVRELAERNIRAALAVNIAMSWSMGLLLLAVAPLAGSFYRSEAVTQVILVQALNFALIPFGAIHMAYYRREMNFKPLLTARLVADTGSLVTSIALALGGLGALSMAWATVVGTALTVVVALAYRKPGFPMRPSLQGAREVLRFGGLASLIYVFSQLGRSAPELVIGRAMSVTDVAFYSRGAGLIQLFRQLVLRAVTPVCLPYFAQSVREEGNVGRAYARGITIFTGVGWVFLGFLAMAAFPAIRLVYGEQWMAAVPLAQILCLAAALELVHHLSREALLAHGQVALASRLQIVIQMAQFAGLAAVLPFGLAGACWGLCAAALVGLALSQWHLHHGTGFGLGTLWTACRPSALVALLALAPMAALAWAWPAGESNYLRFLACGGALTVSAWLLALRQTAHPLWDELLRAGRPLLQRLGAMPTRLGP